MRSDTKNVPEGKPCRLQTLNHVALLPSISSSRGDGLGALERIESIKVSEVGERDGRTVYIMDVYMYQARALFASCRPSFTSFLSVTTADRKPDLSVARRYSEFITLSADVYKLAFAHYAQRCQFCDRMVQKIASGGPTIATKLISSKETKLKHLTAFMHLLLRLALHSAVGTDRCLSQIQIRGIMNQFIQSEQ